MTSTSSSNAFIDTLSQHEINKLCFDHLHLHTWVFAIWKFVLMCNHFLLFSPEISNAMCGCGQFSVLIKYSMNECMNKHFAEMLYIDGNWIANYVCCVCGMKKLLFLFTFEIKANRTRSSRHEFSHTAKRDIIYTFFRSRKIISCSSIYYVFNLRKYTSSFAAIIPCAVAFFHFSVVVWYLWFFSHNVHCKQCNANAKHNFKHLLCAIPVHFTLRYTVLDK